jgi:hypothetical protein
MSGKHVSVFCLISISVIVIWSDVHSFNTRSNHDLHIPVANLTVFQKGVWYSGIKIYNHLPPALKQLSHDIPKFKVALKRFLLANSFYTLEEYYSWK